jgi:1-acyl-sn-glycerol-3-phosphate acyltransferase
MRGAVLRVIGILRAALGLALCGLNTLLHGTPLLLLTLPKLVLPFDRVQRAMSRVLTLIAESWIAVNGALIALVARTHFEVTGLEGLRYGGWYLVLSNHQSWVDILVLQRVFNRRIPFLKFFLKQELIWVPVLGLAWWALDFPFMRRYSREQVERRPELRGKDVEATRRACERFARIPVSVMNFVEGTRFTQAKHDAQASPYAHLLKPKAGGVAFVIAAMGAMIETVVDVTIRYPAGRPTLVDLFAGRVPRVVVDVRTREIPRELRAGDYENDADFRARFQTWIGEIWAEKDRALRS